VKLSSLPDGYELKEHYDVTCPTCGHEFCFRPSLFMTMGYNQGSGTCLKCKAHLTLRIDTSTGNGAADEYKGYVAPEGER